MPMFIAELFTIAKTWKQPNCPQTDEWMKKMWCIYTVEYYSAIKKSLIPGWGAEISHTLWPENQNIKQKWYCNKVNKGFVNGPH